MKKLMTVLAILCALAPFAYSDKPVKSDPWRFRAGIRNSPGQYQLNALQLGQVLESLRQKTGFQEMQFDHAGFLVLGNRASYANGSVTARELLASAVDSRRVFELEAISHSPEIAFAHIASGTIHTSFQTKAQIEMRQVRLDFADFKELLGEREAREAFDLGFAILHELVHGVLGLTDEVGETRQLGECDESVNRMRRELNLPERQGYNALMHTNLPGQAGATKLAELIFTRTRTEPNRSGVERFYLRWEAKRVASVTSRSTLTTRPVMVAVVR